VSMEIDNQQRQTFRISYEEYQKIVFYVTNAMKEFEREGQESVQ